MRFPWSSTSRRRHYKPLLQVPFVGQQAVLTALATHLQTAQNGTVQCVTLAGQVGSGKSALLEEFMFLHCAKPGVLLLQLNAADCLLDHDVYRQLCTALQSHSEQILQKVYTATQRVRKTLALQWDEAEFRQVLASTDWAQLRKASPSTPSVSGCLYPLSAVADQRPRASLGYRGRGDPGCQRAGRGGEHGAAGMGTTLDHVLAGFACPPSAWRSRHRLGDRSGAAWHFRPDARRDGSRLRLAEVYHPHGG